MGVQPSISKPGNEVIVTSTPAFDAGGSYAIGPPMVWQLMIGSGSGPGGGAQPPRITTPTAIAATVRIALVSMDTPTSCRD